MDRTEAARYGVLDVDGDRFPTLPAAAGCATATCQSPVSRLRAARTLV
ncbi:hypothetical protein ABQF34_16055 [Mycolicibacterium boenickei]